MLNKFINYMEKKTAQKEEELKQLNEQIEKKQQENNKLLNELFNNDDLDPSSLDFSTNSLYQKISDESEKCLFVSKVNVLKKSKHKGRDLFNTDKKAVIYITDSHIYILSDVNGVYKDIYEIKKVNGIVYDYNKNIMTYGRTNKYFDCKKNNKLMVDVLSNLI